MTERLNYLKEILNTIQMSKKIWYAPNGMEAYGEEEILSLIHI